MLVRTLAELQTALLSVPPGETIELAPGEYCGPFIIDRPLTLRGLDRQTVLWRRGGPVVYTRVPGVQLENVLIERTVDAHGPTAIHNAGCLPLGSAGKNSVELNGSTNNPNSKPTGDLLISLGELVPGATLTLPLELEVAARTEIAVIGLHGATINPAVLETPGLHVVRLTLEGNTVQKGEMLLGEIALRERDRTRYMWVSGIVLDSPLPDAAYCLAAPKVKLYTAASGLTLDGQLLSYLAAAKAPPTEDQQPAQPGRFAFVQRDPSGTLFLYLPSEPAAPVLLNDSALVRGTRILLREADVITLKTGTGEVALTVEAAEALPVSVAPEVVEFADFDDNFPATALVNLNTGRAAWRGQLVATVPWLSVDPDGNVRLSGSRMQQWKVSLNETALTLPDGAYLITGGLVVNGATHIIGLDVRVTIRRPGVALRVLPADLGAIEYRWPTERILDIAIENFGRSAWSGTVKATVPWLEVITPMPISNDGWSLTAVQVGFAPAWDSLTVGVQDVPDALIVTASDGDHPIPVRLDVTPAKGHLVIEVPLVVFEDVERGVPSMPDAILRLRNDGGAAYTGHANVVNGWVQLPPGEITLAAGEATEITVELLDIPADQPLDAPVVIDEIRFDSGETVSVQLTLIERPPFLVARPVNFAPFVKGDPPPEGLLTVHNMGPAVWRGTLKANLPWLTAPDRQFTCEPNESIDAYVTLTGRALDVLTIGINRFENALAIIGGREPVSVPVQIDLRDAALELFLDTATLNFGLVNGAVIDLPTETVRVLNGSPTIWKGRVEVGVPWLSLEGEARSFDLEVPKMSVAEFKVLLNDSARWLPPGLISDDRALTISGERQKLAVRVLLHLNEWTPRLEVKPSHMTLNADAAQTLTVRNVGGKPWPLQISAAPWLRVSPNIFTLEPAQEQRIDVRRSPDPALSTSDMVLVVISTLPLDDPRAIVIIAPGREIEIRVEIAKIG